MRLLYIHQYFSTPAGHGGTRSYEFARRWIRAGHQVTVLTSRAFDDTLPEHGTVVVDGIQVRVLGGRYSPNMGFYARLWSFLAFALQTSWVAARARQFDLVLATSTPLSVAIPALAAAWIGRRPYVFEVRDVWPDGAVDAGVLHSRVLIGLAGMLERAAYRHARQVVPLSTGMQSRIAAKGVPASKLTMLPNCADLELFHSSQFDRAALRRESGVEGRFVLLYMGAINVANDMPFLATAIRALRDDPRFLWWFVGGGNRLEYLRGEVRASGATNVVFHGRQPKLSLPRFVAAADVGVVSFLNAPVFFENSPNKCFDYCAGGLPPVFTRTTWLGPWLRDHRAGYVCEHNTVDEFVQVLRLLAGDEALRRQTGENARRMVEQEFSRDAIAARYLEVLTKALAGPAGNP